MGSPKKITSGFKVPPQDVQAGAEAIVRAIREVFDLRPKAIIDQLDLLRPIYAQTAAYGHFGRELPDFTWERTDRVDALDLFPNSHHVEAVAVLRHE